MLSQDQQQKLIQALLKKPENANCADCNSKSPCWASLDFGVFICMNCSGAHRALGPSITRVKSTKLDTWDKNWLLYMQIGNTVINQYFEHSKSDIMNKKPNINSNLSEIKKYIFDKYMKRLYAMPGQDDPISNLKNGKPPITTATNTTGKEKQENKEKEKAAKNEKKQKPAMIDLMDFHDDASDAQNKNTSGKNEMAKKQINLFELSDAGVSVSTESKKYNKDHFNSFSGYGAQHSSTGNINFDGLFNHSQMQRQSNNQKKQWNFDDITKVNHEKPQSQAINQLPMFPKQNYLSGYGNVYPSNQQHNSHNYQTMCGFGNQTPHVTMNINMNMQPMFMNINMAGSSTQPTYQNPTAKISLCEPFTLDSKKSEEKATEKQISSWVDAWK